MAYQKIIDIANPSIDKRSGYAQITLESLELPEKLLQKAELQLRETKTTNNLGLNLKNSKNNAPVPYQIDHVFGSNFKDKGVLVIKCDALDGIQNNDDYKASSAQYVLEHGVSSNITQEDNLWVGGYYEPEKPSKSLFYSQELLADKDLYGIKLYNGLIEIFFSLKNKLDKDVEVDYTGAVTSINLQGMAGDLTFPFGFIYAKPTWARWGQITDIAFFPTPWDITWFQKKALWGREYELVYKKDGPVRAVASVRAGPFVIQYKGAPFFSEEIKTVECYLYRILYVYPNQPFYFEQLNVLSKDGHSLSFRPYFLSCIPSLAGERSSFDRFEHVPNYLAVWRTYASLDIGYGFSADSHVRGIKIWGNDISWRLQTSHTKTCINSFCCINNRVEDTKGRLDFIGAQWYENILKPLRPTPLSQTFNLPLTVD